MVEQMGSNESNFHVLWWCKTVFIAAYWYWPTNKAKMLAYLNDSDKIKYVKLEIAAVIDYNTFVKATYNLEGDGLVALSC